MNQKNWNFSISKKRQTYSCPKKPQYYYRKKTPKIEFDKEQNEHRYLTYCVQQHSANPILTKISFDDKHQDYIDFNKLFIDLEKEFNFIKKNPLKPKNNFEKALQKIKIKRAEILKNILSSIGKDILLMEYFIYVYFHHKLKKPINRF